MIMTGALHAHRRFTMPAVAPIFNNVVVIAVYLAYAVMRGGRDPSVTGITSAETWLLGAGTTAGVVAMTLCLVPQLRRLGWRFRPRMDLSHPAVRRGARLGVWALGYAGGYQAGLIVVLLLANKVEGGVAAYQWAFTFFYLPHALFAIPIFHVLFTAMSEHAARGETPRFVERLTDGLTMLAFLLIPLAVFMLIVAERLTRVTLEYGVMTGAGARQVAVVLAAFVVGLPTYSAFLVFTRAFYAVSDAKTPALVNASSVVIASVVGALLFLRLPEGAAVAGLAVGHSVGFAVGAVALARMFSTRWGALSGDAVAGSLGRTVLASGLAGAVMFGLDRLLPTATKIDLVWSLAVIGIAGAVAYLVVMHLAGSRELARVRSLIPRAAA